MTLLEHAAQSEDMGPHLRTLIGYASRCETIIEFGVRTGVSTWAFLDGLPPTGRLASVDTQAVIVPDRVRDDRRWTMFERDDRDDQLHPLLPKPDLVLIDTTHEYHHTLEELAIADRLGARWVLLHDWNLPDVQDAAHGFMRRAGTFALETVEPSRWGLGVMVRA